MKNEGPKNCQFARPSWCQDSTANKKADMIFSSWKCNNLDTSVLHICIVISVAWPRRTTDIYNEINCAQRWIFVLSPHSVPFLTAEIKGSMVLRIRHLDFLLSRIIKNRERKNKQTNVHKIYSGSPLTWELHSLLAIAAFHYEEKLTKEYRLLPNTHYVWK